MTAKKIAPGIYLTPSPDLNADQEKEVREIISGCWGGNFAEEDILKKARQRLVVRIFVNGSSMILKLFPLDKITSRLRHRKFARREFLNYRKANEVNIPTPKCYALIEQREFGMVRCSGVLLADISNSTDALLLSKSIPYELAAEQCLPALSLLYEKGVNHIDAREENILFSEGGWVIIDWQYAIFVNPRADWLLEHLAAYFIKKAPMSAQKKLEGQWLKKLHECADHHHDFELFHARVLQLRSKHQGNNARKKLRPS